MKTTRKLLAMVLAVMMVMSLATTAFAEETKYTITAPADSTRTYEVYQIFTGDYHDKKLSNVVWGANGIGTVGEAVTDEQIKELTDVNTKSDTEKLAVIETYVNFDSAPIGTVEKDKPLSVDPGYYLIKDNGPVGDGESYSLYIVQVANDITISPKVGKVESGKKVKDTNDTDNTVSDWQDAADYDVGDDVPFQLWAKLPEDYANYTKGYKLTFHDTLSAGLQFNNDVKVYIDGVEITTGFEVVTTGLSDGCTFEVKFANLKEIDAAEAGSTITVEYTAKLLPDAVSGTAGNPNTSNVTYTNNPNDEQAGENGETPEDTVVVFTYDLIVDKVDSDKKPLDGAGFTLYKWDASVEGEDKWVAVGAEVKDVTTFEFKKLDEGKYKLVETTVPAGYNKAADIIFTIESTLTDSELTNLVVKDVTGATVNDFTVNVDEGKIATDIVNKAGTELPSTGGMGTTLFYVFGAIMMVGAAVLLVTKKRMASAE